MAHLVVFSHKHFRRTWRGLETTGALSVQIDALAPYFDRVTLCVPVSDRPGFTGASIVAQNVSFQPVPAYADRLGFVRKTPQLRQAVLMMVERADLGLAIVPGYFGILASTLCQRQSFPLFQWVVSDWSETVLARRSDPVSRCLIRTLACPIMDMVMSRLTRDVLTFYTGHILYHPRGHLQHVRVSSSIRQSELSSRKSPSRIRYPVRLLFVGRLSEEKGLFHLLQALVLLREEEIPVRLNLVGTGALQRDLRDKVVALSLEEQVVFSGFVPHGERLHRHYSDSSMLVLPSLQEQQGKVLLEAMGQGLPVIASRVGGIPTVVTHGETGLLVPPGDPHAIAAAINRLIADAALRQRLIAGGLEYARAHTVDAETERMMRILAHHFDGMLEGVA